MVLRWEWVRGSTLFIVWQQDRRDDAGPADLVRPGDLVNALTAAGDNFVALKLSYWLPVL